MAVGFNAILFDVVVDDSASLPYVVADEDGIERYTASLIMDSKVHVDALNALLSKVTIFPALGGGGLIVVERGFGSGTFIYPGYGGTTVTTTAILVSFAARSHAVLSNHWTVDAEWVMTTGADT